MSTRNSQRLLYAAVGLLCCLFIFLRLYKLSSSLLYYNDMGRDSLVLMEWSRTGKPPLLGPQTSALPFNQSAIYFYTLYPIFLLSSMSAFSAIYTLVLFQVGFVVIGTYLLRNKPFYLRGFLIAFLLFTLHPQSILQHRFIWNPSFLSAFLTTSIISFLLLHDKWSWKRLFLFVSSLAIANAFSYSAVPIILALFVVSPFLFRWKALWIYFGFGVASVVANAPTLFFELRHRFVLLGMLMNREKITQQAAGFSRQTYDLILHTIAHQKFQVSLVVVVILFFALALGYVWYRKHTKLHEERRIFEVTVLLLIVSITLTILIPMSIHSHYIFGIATLLFLSIGFLPPKHALATVGFLAVLWSVPIFQGKYFSPARRTVAELEGCFTQVCQHESSPLYVSEQAGFHPFHNAPEHRFLMRKVGCNIADIETQPGVAQKMAVILDDGTYEHGKTAYNELTLFGTSKEVRNYVCKENFQVRILEK